MEASRAFFVGESELQTSGLYKSGLAPIVVPPSHAPTDRSVCSVGKESSALSLPETEPDIGKEENRIASLFIARGLSVTLAKAVALECRIESLVRSDIRNLAAAVARSESLLQRLGSGHLTPHEFVKLPSNELATEKVQEARQKHAEISRQEVTVDKRAEGFAIVCEACGAEDALGMWIITMAGEGPTTIGRAVQVKRGECACGHVWVDEGK